MNIEIPSDDEIYKRLHRISFNKNSDSEKKLFKFFEEEIPDEEENDSNVKNIEMVCATRKLFYYQRNALDGVIHYLDSDKHRCLLHMPTGSGKTITAMRAVATFFLRSKPTLVIWLAYSEDLCEQAIDEFKKTWENVGDRDIPVFRFFGTHSSDLIEQTRENKEGLIVAGLRKIHQADKKKNVFLSTLADRVDLVIMDEAHQAMAPTYREVLEQLTEKHLDSTSLLGLSATPGRTSASSSDELANFFNHKKITLETNTHKNPVQYLIDEGYLAKPKTLSIRANAKLSADDLDKISKDSMEIPENILDKIGHDSRRTLKIIFQVEELIKSGHKRIIVFGTNVTNSRDISMILRVLGYNAFHVDASTTTITKKQYVDEYKADTDETIIMCNYGVFTTGFDAPKTSATIIARPTKSLVLYSQMVGRAMRGTKVGGNKVCEIQTITDIKLPQFTKLIENFFEWEDVW